MFIFEDVQVPQNGGEGGWGRGGEVIWAMPERKHSFFQEVFPYHVEMLYYMHLQSLG